MAHPLLAAASLQARSGLALPAFFVWGGAIQARLKAARATRLFGPIFATAGLVAMTKARPRQAEICSRKIAAVIEIIR